MTKEGKGAATIRRRKLKHSQKDLEHAQSHKQFVPDADEAEFDEDEEGYLFDDEILGPSVVKKIMSSEKTLLLGLIALRITNGLLIQTYYAPDEIWQSLEVAHNMTFGFYKNCTIQNFWREHFIRHLEYLINPLYPKYQNAFEWYGYMTWEWRYGLRGYLYPSVFALLYKILAILHLDYRILLIKLPRILQGVFAAFGDLYLYKLSWKLSDRATAQWTLFCQISSWFTLFCCTRTLTNSTEAVLVTIALYYFPWPNSVSKSSSTRTFICLAVLSVLIRPTAAIIWILMCSWHLQQNTNKLWKTIKVYLQCCSVILPANILLDRLFYGKWVFVQYNFLEFNVLRGDSAFYGTNPWHWYITQGYPVLMTVHLYPFILGAWHARNKVLLFLILWTIFIYSFISHKEDRFLMPILPISMHYCGVYFKTLCKKPRLRKKRTKCGDRNSRDTDSIASCSSTDSLISIETENNETTESSARVGDNIESTLPVIGDTENIPQELTRGVPDLTSGKGKDTKETSIDPLVKQQNQHKYNLTKAKVIVIVLVICNLSLAMYFGLIHNRGNIVVMKYLFDKSQDRNIDVMFLMPCHSTPYYSYIHQNVTMRFLTCEPNLSQQENYIDEADEFFNDPLSWLRQEYHIQEKPLPSYLVYYQSLQNDIAQFLQQTGYRQCKKFFNMHIKEGNKDYYIVVSCR